MKRERKKGISIEAPHFSFLSVQAYTGILTFNNYFSKDNYYCRLVITSSISTTTSTTTTIVNGQHQLCVSNVATHDFNSSALSPKQFTQLKACFGCRLMAGS